MESTASSPNPSLPFLRAPLGSAPTHALPTHAAPSQLMSGPALLGRPRGNLCGEAQSRGLRIGVIGFGVTLALAITLAKLGVASELRWLLAAPFFVSMVGVSESLLQTCPFLALQSLCDRGEGLEPIADPTERARLRSRAKRVLLTCGSLALCVAGSFAQLPLS